ncbi:MAG: bifunctional enoyl-CoA hydratase/phosphate acetyltransferase [Smithella sp. PtaU1.Bin162]|nr:MAG: bifunctional enoyl-CoA hydratase/phosphate acetyltransferase [Smithella sp. PtaU1.Bin162]
MADLKEIIEKGIEKYKRDRVGKISNPPLGNEIATKDAIRHFANGLGDPNPLWRDEEYAKNSPHGGLIAPPFFLNAVSESQAITGLPGLIATFVGSGWVWHRPIRVNDRFSVTNKLLELKDLPDSNGRRRLMQSGLLNYSNQRGELVGSCRWDMMRTEMKPGQAKRDSGGEESVKNKYRHYSEEELAEIYAAVEREEIRGKSPRFFEDVNSGDELIPVVKGPLSLSDMVAWAIGISWHRIELAHGMKLLHLRDNPGLSYIDPDLGSPEPIANSHFWPQAAKILMGSSLPLDLGFQRVSWLGHLVTNWMSDFGFLRKLEARLKGLVQFGDTLWCAGKVAGKRKEEGKYLVDLELWCRNQRDEITTTGKAVVELPAKTSFLNHTEEDNLR